MTFFLGDFVVNKKDNAKRIYLLVILLGLIVLTLNLPIFSMINQEWEGISAIVINNYVGILLIFIGSILYYLYIKEKIDFKYISLIIKSIIIIIACLFVFFLINAIINNNIDWGHGRLMIWNRGIEAWTNDFSIKEKIIGLGPENARFAYAKMSLDLGIIVSNAHNSLVQMLLTGGIVGAFAWLMININIVISYIKGNKSIYFLALISFFAQSFVNCMNPNNIGLLILILALFIKEDRTEN